MPVIETAVPPVPIPSAGVTPLTVGTAARMVSEMVELVKAAGPFPVLPSVPCTVKVQVQAAVGVPEIVPVLERLRPAGSVPLATVVEKTYGVAPPFATSPWLYAVFTTPLARLAGVTTITGEETVMETVALPDVTPEPEAE